MSGHYSILHPMTLLLKGQGYPPAVLLAVGLHAGLLYFLLDRELTPRDMVDLERPEFISATTIRENPQKANREQQEAQEAVRREAEAAAARQRAAEEAAREEAERQAAEEERRQQEVVERRAREEEEARRAREAEEAAEAERLRQEQLAREQAEREAEAERQAEAARQAAEQAAAEEAAANSAIGSYKAIIHETISNSWVIPPSARDGMSVLLNIRLVPTGEVVSVDVIQSSGDAAFDRAAEQAVWKARGFPELQEMPISLFEREFRSFRLLFRPEDLLR